MSDASPGVSLATRAKRLTALARATKQNEKESQDLGQVQTALNRLDQELVKLRGVLEVRRRLKVAGVPVPEVPDLKGAPGRLQDQIETVGRPTAQFLNARTKDVTGAYERIASANIQAWRTWAVQRIEQLPIALLPRVPLSRRGETTTRIAKLRKMAAGTPAIADIIQFQNSYDLIVEEFNSVDEAAIDEVLKRFTAGRIRLSDLSDSELEALREDESLRDQLYLHIAP